MTAMPGATERPQASGESQEADPADDPDSPQPGTAGSLDLQFAPDSRLLMSSRGMAIEAMWEETIQSPQEIPLQNGPTDVTAPPSTSDHSQPLSPSSPSPTPTPEPTPVPVVFPTECQIQRGETVWAIAERYYGSADYVRLISYANDLSYDEPVIFAGQVLALPDPSTPVPAPTPAPAPAPAPGGGTGSYQGFSAAEIDLYLRIVAAECGAGWSYEGCLMVSQVIVNRLRSGRWGGLYGVLTAPNQFTPYWNGYYRYVTPTATQRQAALDALDGATAFGRDVIYFCTDAAYARSPWFQSMPLVTRYANTLFFNP